MYVWDCGLDGSSGQLVGVTKDIRISILYPLKLIRTGTRLLGTLDPSHLILRGILKGTGVGFDLTFQGCYMCLNSRTVLRVSSCIQLFSFFKCSSGLALFQC